ncbi:MAG: hypothetical protein PHW15_02785 [Patescibacteria group bacterium]|nr:hypothetical protein [Patescibacteria group bacterium]
MVIEKQEIQKEYFIIFIDKSNDISHIAKYIPLKSPDIVKKRMLELHEKEKKIAKVLTKLSEENLIEIVVEPSSRFFIVREK